MTTASLYIQHMNYQQTRTSARLTLTQLGQEDLGTLPQQVTNAAYLPSPIGKVGSGSFAHRGTWSIGMLRRPPP